MAPTLTLFFIVEPPRYERMACYLAATIRQHMPKKVKLVGYCPAHRMAELDPDVVECLRRMGCEVRPFQAEGRFDPPYPHGNKLLACLEPRDTDFSGFMDSDIVMLRDNTIETLVAPGSVSAAVATSMYWAPQSIWNKIYAACGMEVPEERVMLMRDKRKPMIPYFNSGFVLFPNGPVNDAGQSFAEIWMETATVIDRIEGLEHKRPYLDQMSLPVAIRRAGLAWKELPEEQHFIMGGSLRGKPLPEGMAIHTAHYRKWEILREAGMAEHAYRALRKAVGTRRISKIFDQPLPKGIAPPSPPRTAAADTKTAPPAPEHPGAHPTPCRIAAVTMVYRDYFFLERWIGYYAPQIGRENIYILRHGEDPEIDRIAYGTNVIHLPNPPDKSRFDRRRWATLSDITSALTQTHDWVLCNDVDEIVAPDPEIAGSLSEYLARKMTTAEPPVAIVPFGVEIVHTPRTETETITPERPLLSTRRNFRLNSNYSKPCITRVPIRFASGGHASNLRHTLADPKLFLFHLRYVDDTISRERLVARKRWMEERYGALGENDSKRTTWDQGEARFLSLSVREPTAETVEFNKFFKDMLSGHRFDGRHWYYRSKRSTEIYRLPERFAGLF